MKKISISALLFLLASNSIAQNGFIKIATTNYEWMDGCFENRIAFKTDGKYGYCDSSGKVVIAAQFADYYQFTNGFAKATKDKSSYYYIDKNGIELTNSSKEYITPINNGEYYQIKNGTAIFYDKTKKVKGELAVKLCGDYAEGMIAVLSNENLWGFANLSPQIVIPCEYKSFSNFKDGLAVANKGEYSENKTGVINTKGEVVIPFEYHLIFRLKNYFLLEINHQYSAYDIANGTMVKEPLELKYYSYMNLFSRDFKIAKNVNGELALFNNQLKQECSISYDDCRFADDETGLVAVKKNNLWGMIDKSGKELVECKYDDIGTCYNGLIRVEKSGIQGFVDRTGKLVIPLQFTKSNSFYSKTSTAMYNGSYVLLRCKTPAELKAEEQLIAQKKLPTAEECFELALAATKPKQDPSIAKTNDDDFAIRNSKEQVLGRQVENYLRYFRYYNEEYDKLLKEITACLKAPITKTCTNEHWRHTNDANYAWIGVTQNLKRMKSELNEIKKVNYSYLCSNNSTAILKKIESNIKEIDNFLNSFEISFTSQMEILVSRSIEGGDFSVYANELKEVNAFYLDQANPPALTITESGMALNNLLAGCK